MDYAGWVADGSPYIDCTPNVQLATVLRGYGYTVYTKGDRSHMTARPPEDHAPFSATGWPVPSPYPYGHAIDIMAPPAGSGLPSLSELGRQLFDDRTGEVPGAALIKYMNWEPYGPGGSCWHDSWQPAHARVASTDRGHIHVSWRSDATHKDLSGYDPVARLRGDDMPTVKEIWNTDGIINNRPFRPDFATNPTVQPETALVEAWDEAHDAVVKVVALTETVNAQGKMLLLLAAKLDELLARPSGGAAGPFTGTFEARPS